MKKKMLCAALCAMLLLGGCGTEPEPVGKTEPTLPSIDTGVTPKEQLSAAVAKTKALRIFTVTLEQISETEKDRRTQTAFWQVGIREDGTYAALLQSYTVKNSGTPEDELACWYDGKLQVEKTRQGVTRQEWEPPLTPAEIFDRLGPLVENGILLETFCRQKLTVSPSNDGSIHFITRDLTMEDYQQMLYGDVRAWSLRNEWHTVELTVDKEGRLSGLSFESGQENGQKDTVIVTILPGDSFPTAPDWTDL